MKTYKNIFIVALMAISQLIAPMALAADTAIATMDLSGNVPVIFNVTARGYPGDLDLSPNVVVNGRLLGIFHMKYNVSLATLTLKASTATGKPETGAAVAYSFGVAWTVSLICSSVDPAKGTTITPLIAGVEMASTGGKALAAVTGGIEEDCPLTASWGGTAVTLPLSGKYSMTYTLTMVSI